MFALPQEQLSIFVEVSAKATVEEAIRESKIIEKYPEIDLAINKTGIFGKPAKLDAGLHQDDRVEIYRPLLCDPKEMRKLRARENVKGSEKNREKPKA
jgi:putative ubiquitin-RnfH superfamily antitoxin RatB of RatAB toxin-antitoxin module